MSGAEVLGVVAAATQLVEYALKIVSSIAKEYTKHQRFSEKAQSHQINFQDLIGIAGYIQQNTALHTRFISEKLNTTLYEAERLLGLLNQECHNPTKHSVKKYWIWIGSNSEDVISEGLKRLEKQKTSLHLRISVAQAGISSQNTLLLKDIQESLTTLSAMPSGSGSRHDGPKEPKQSSFEGSGYRVWGSNAANEGKEAESGNKTRGKDDEHTGTKSSTTNKQRTGHKFGSIEITSHVSHVGDKGEPSDNARAHEFKSVKVTAGVSYLGDDTTDGSSEPAIVEKAKGPFDKRSK